MSELKQIIVPFECKTEARKLGAVFNKEDRQWYIPANATKEQIQLLNNLKTSVIKTSVVDEICNHIEDDNLRENVVNNTSQKTTLFSLNETSSTSWETLLQTKNALEIALAIQRFGMPPNAEQRIEILKFLSLRKPGEYPITYEGLIECSESFANLYSKEYVVEIVKKCIKDGRPYTEQVKNADISDEEKALVLMVLPL